MLIRIKPILAILRPAGQVCVRNSVDNNINDSHNRSNRKKKCDKVTNDRVRLDFYFAGSYESYNSFDKKTDANESGCHCHTNTDME
jgi:hypothetical protein